MSGATCSWQEVRCLEQRAIFLGWAGDKILTCLNATIVGPQCFDRCALRQSRDRQSSNAGLRHRGSTGAGALVEHVQRP
jgi:hypothetical protein